VTHLRQIMLEELRRRNFADSTIRSYLHAVEQFSHYFHRRPDQLGPEHIRQYQAALFTNLKFSPNTVTLRLAALRFYIQVLKRSWSIAETPYPKKVFHLPEILSQEQVARLIDAAEFPFHRILLMTLYATGARRAEVAHLKISDIDSQRMVIHIRGGKGRNDRDVMLSPKLLEALRVYWRGLRHKPTEWLFPGNRWHTASYPVTTKVLWTAGGAEMPSGEMQVDRRFFKVAMAEQHLDGTQVGAGFEQMRGKAMAQRMGVDVLVRKTSAFGGLLTGVPENLGGDRMTRRAPSAAGEQPIGGLAFQPAPVDAQRLEQLRAEHDIAILAPLASPNMNDHPLAVDVADLEARHFCAPRARAIQRHQQNAMKGRLCRVDQSCDFFRAEYLGQVQNLLRIRRLGNAPTSLQHLNIEETQRCQPLRHSVRGQLPAREQRGLILANLLGAKLIG
jgi:integrase/recombinase XerD